MHSIYEPIRSKPIGDASLNRLMIFPSLSPAIPKCSERPGRRIGRNPSRGSCIPSATSAAAPSLVFGVLSVSGFQICKFFIPTVRRVGSQLPTVGSVSSAKHTNQDACAPALPRGIFLFLYQKIIGFHALIPWRTVLEIYS